MNAVAMITGASRGIGRGIALELAHIGHDLVLNYATNESAARKTAEDCRAAAAAHGHTIRVELCRADVGSAADRQSLVQCARAQFGRLDLLVNNAGIASIGRADLLEASEENFDRLMAVNLKGPFFLTQLAARWMIELAGARTPSSGRSAKIITISSISSFTASINRGDYCMAKAALTMMTRLFAARLADHGICVYEICPGIIDSDMTAPVREKYDALFAQGIAPIRRWGQPADVAKAVSAIAQDFFPYSTGESINVDGGFHIQRL